MNEDNYFVHSTEGSIKYKHFGSGYRYHPNETKEKPPMEDGLNLNPEKKFYLVMREDTQKELTIYGRYFDITDACDYAERMARFYRDSNFYVASVYHKFSAIGVKHITLE